VINPVNHGANARRGGDLKTEPYVVAATSTRWRPHRAWRMELVHGVRRMDVPAHRRVVARAHARRELSPLRAVPCPPTGPRSGCNYRYRETPYDISVRQMPAAVDEAVGATTVTVDGVVQSDDRVHLIDDHAAHQVVVALQVLRA